MVIIIVIVIVMRGSSSGSISSRVLLRGSRVFQKTNEIENKLAV